MFRVMVTAGILILLWLGAAEPLSLNPKGENEKEMSLEQFVPQKMGEWSSEGPDEIYYRDTIFDYMNGAGEVYRMYSFRELLVRRFTNAGESDITVELFDMGTSGDAFGVFAHNREGQDEGIGQGSEYRGGLLCFWKSKYLVCVFAEKDTPSAKKTVINIAKAIDQAIKDEGIKPELLGHLPEEGLMETSIRYFHTHVSLNYHYYIADKNILNLNQDTEAVLVRYQKEESKCYLLLVRYRNGKEAKDAFKGFAGAYMPEATGTGIIQTENGKWTGADVTREFVVVVLDAHTEAIARTLVERVKHRLEEERP